ncbi:MAG TPA: DUF4239 domain-containing protein [Kofleriaceae bacterium]|nr:DUF4239 domain-containing protein [Kofleriaceae bacterium]
MPRWVRTFLRLTPVVALVSAVSVVGLVGFRVIVPPELLRGAANELGNYLQTVGSIYAVLLAFVVYVVWGQFNDVRIYLDREATALVDLHRTSSGLPSRSRAAIQRGLRDYVDAVLRDEWPAMAARDEATIDRVAELLEHVWLAIHGCRPANDCQHTVYGEVLSRFNQLTDLRTSRLSAARARIPLAMTILLYNGALLTVGSVYLLAFDQLWLHALVTAALAGAIAHILYLIRDLDDAFDGDWQVARTPFEHARKNFDRAAHVVDIDAA